MRRHDLSDLGRSWLAYTPSPSSISAVWGVNSLDFVWVLLDLKLQQLDLNSIAIKKKVWQEVGWICFSLSWQTLLLWLQSSTLAGCYNVCDICWTVCLRVRDPWNPFGLHDIFNALLPPCGQMRETVSKFAPTFILNFLLNINIYVLKIL